jgi:ribosomal protein S18 acetylase RimI-like enzyme
VEVRKAAVADAGAIATVHVRTWQEAYAHVFDAERLARIDPERRRAHWERGIAAGEAVFVAEDEGRVVGFVSIGASRERDEEGELFAIYVLPEAWGSGAGAALMREAIGALRAAGHREAILWVLEDNPRARRFYEREGWSLDGARKEDEFLGLRVAEVRYRISLI